MVKYMRMIDVQSTLQTIEKWLLKAKIPLIVILGPTASGKTSLSVRLARKLTDGGQATEIVNADSRQLYKFLDIGTAKITENEMQNIPHRLFSIIDPKEHVTIAWYKDMAETLIGELHAKNTVPILVGGSMLYISAVIDGLQPAPTADPGIRKKLEAEYEKDGGELLRERLVKVDPESAASFPLKNRRYLIRALEIHAQTGSPKSAQMHSKISGYDLLIFGMDAPREMLHENIAKRTDEMLERGWVEEVKKLLQSGYSEKDPGMESHGYRDIITYLKGEKSLPETRQKIIERTRQYMKRQITWWRNDPRIRWITPMNGDET